MENKRGADYVLCVKQNQKNLFEELEWWHDGFGEDLPPGAKTYSETDKGHGRIEVRRYTQFPVTEQMELALKWKDIQSIVRVERERTIGDKVTLTVQYYITSHAVNVR